MAPTHLRPGMSSGPRAGSADRAVWRRPAAVRSAWPPPTVLPSMRTGALQHAREPPSQRLRRLRPPTQRLSVVRAGQAGGLRSSASQHSPGSAPASPSPLRFQPLQKPHRSSPNRLPPTAPIARPAPAAWLGRTPAATSAPPVGQAGPTAWQALRSMDRRHCRHRPTAPAKHLRKARRQQRRTRRTQPRRPPTGRPKTNWQLRRYWPGRLRRAASGPSTHAPSAGWRRCSTRCRCQGRPRRPCALVQQLKSRS